MPYKEDGSGTLWVPNKGNGQEKAKEADRLIESLKESVREKNQDEEWLGDYSVGSFELEEMYVNGDDLLTISGNIEDVFVNLNIPIKNNEQMQKIAQDINKVVTIDPESSGLYLKPKDFSEVRNKTADGQGRINLGKDYSGENVRVVVLDED